MPIPVVETYKRNFGTTIDTLTCDKPVDVAVNDFLVLIGTQDSNSGTLAFSDNKTGWDFRGAAGNTAADAHIGVFTRFADGTEGSSESITADDTYDFCMFYLRISGVDLLASINGSAFSQAGAAASHSIGGLTTDEDNCLILCGASFDGGDGYPFGISGTGWSKTDEEQVSTSSSVNSAVWGQRDLASQGATGTVTLTPSVTDGAAWFQMAIKGAASPGGSIVPVVMQFHNQFAGGILL